MTIVRVYSDDELRYSASARCKCGAGLAYPRDNSQPNAASVFVVASDWICSSVLRGEAMIQHHESYPFSFYDIKSEDQPSAMGRTTRPPKS